MKSRTLISGVIIILAIFMGNYAIGEDEYVPSENEEIYGTWVNPEYGKTEASFSQKRIINPDGTWEEYSSMADIGYLTWEYTIIDKWTDSEGNIWYKLNTWYGNKAYGAIPYYDLHRISNSGLTWEFVSSTKDYPTEIDPDHPMYFIYYRQ